MCCVLYVVSVGLQAGDGDRVVTLAAQLNLITAAGRDTSLLPRDTSHVIRDTLITWQTDTWDLTQINPTKQSIILLV